MSPSALEQSNATSLVRRATDILHVLRDKIALLPGSRDRHDHPIIIIPSKDASYILNGDDVRNVLFYLHSVTSASSKNNGFIFIIDTRKGVKSENVKLVLKVIQDHFPGLVYEVFIIRSDSFWEKQKSTGKYKFKVQKLSVEELTKYIDASQLPTEIGGFMKYDHEEWIENRLEIETVIWKICDIMSAFDKFKKEMNKAEFPFDVNSAEQAIVQHSSVSKFIQDASMEQIDNEIKKISHKITGGIINSPDDGYNSSLSISAINPDLAAVIPHLGKLLETLRQNKDEIFKEWEHRRKSLDHCYQLKLFEQDAEKLFEWIRSHYNLTVQRMTDLGENEELATIYLQDHTDFKKAAENTYVSVTHIITVAKRLKEQGHVNKNKIENIAKRLEEEWKLFEQRIEQRLTLLQLSVSFHKRANFYLSNSNSWKSNIGVDPSNFIDAPSDKLEIAIAEHEKFGDKINQAYAEAIADGRSLSNQLKATCRSSPELSGQLGSSQLIEEMNQQITKVHKEIHLTWHKRKVKLHARLAMLAFKNDIQLVISWLEQHGEPYLGKNIAIGENLQASKSLLKNHQHFKTVASNTYSNAQKIFKASQTLMENGECDIKEMNNVVENLRKRLDKFSERIEARTILLNKAILFYTHFMELMQWYDKQDLKSSSYEIVDIDVEKCEKRRDEWIRETEATGQACATTITEGQQLINCLYDQAQSMNIENKDVIKYIEVLIGQIKQRQNLLSERFGRQRTCLQIALRNAVLILDCEQIQVQLINWKKDMSNLITCEPDKAENVLPFHNENTYKVKKAVAEVKATANGLLQVIDSNGINLRNEVNEPIRDLIINAVKKVKLLEDEVMQASANVCQRMENAIQINRIRIDASRTIQIMQREETQLLRMNRIPQNFEEAEAFQEQHDNFQRVVEEKVRPSTINFCQRAQGLRSNFISADENELINAMIMNVTRKWSRLVCLIEERSKLLKSADACYKSLHQNVLPILEQLEHDYKSDQKDFCSLKPYDKRTELAKLISEKLEKHEQWKERFVKGSAYAQKTSENFLKYIRRCGAPEDHIKQREEEIKNVKENLRERQSRILKMWSNRKKAYEQCQQAVLIQATEQRISQWLQDEGETFMAQLPTVIALKNSPHTKEQLEAWKGKLSEFKKILKNEREQVKTFLSAAEGYLKNGINDIHSSTTERAIQKVKENFSSFCQRMQEIELQILTSLGNQRNSGTKNEFSLDRVSDSSLDEKIQKRTSSGIVDAKLMEPMKELLKSERDYVVDLETCFNVYIKTYRASTSSLPGSLKGKEKEIFGNIEALKVFHSEIFMKELEKYEENPEEVGNSFITWMDKLNELYTTYCVNKEQNNHIISMQECLLFFNEVRQRHSLEHNKDLQSMVIKPVQRITRYRLMLEQLLRNAKSNIDEIKEAYDVVVDVPRKANDMIHLKRLEGYDEDDVTMGEFVMQETFLVSDNKHLFKKARERQVFLFELCIIFAKKIEVTPKIHKYVTKDKLMLADVSIREHVEGDICKFSLRMGNLPNSDMSIDLKSKTEKSKMIWIKRIRDLMQGLLQYNIGLSTMNNDSDSKRSSRTSAVSKDSAELALPPTDTITEGNHKTISERLQVKQIGNFEEYKQNEENNTTTSDLNNTLTNDNILSPTKKVLENVVTTEDVEKAVPKLYDILSTVSFNDE
ncbi:Kalirin [Strongyloides ratti]|uniref:Kalirin n=1 Tax=Strongyloides ratti TaxID=34506 RepID=A0A090MWY5_STRRB|nr:Kalirin [Strongyloides ratti]CEF64494.1 Kalirin [Strongyloides ratti]